MTAAPPPAVPDPDAERAPAPAPELAEQVLARFAQARLWAAARANLTDRKSVV